MQVSLELYEQDLDRDPFANVICHVVPRVGEYILLLAGEAPEHGRYRVQYVEHLLDPRRSETLQHVCAVVARVADPGDTDR